MELATLFNHNRSMFFDTDDQGRVSFRGKYLAEFEESTYSSRIVGMSLSGFKGKDLSGLADVFPLIKRLTIEKTSNIKSLNGIEKFTNLEELSIEAAKKEAEIEKEIEKEKYTPTEDQLDILEKIIMGKYNGPEEIINESNPINPTQEDLKKLEANFWRERIIDKVYIFY